jgi:hypothetical protein
MTTAQILPFNPLDKKNLGASVAEALVTSQAHPLGVIGPFKGVGIYAIYYRGNFAAYKPLADANSDRQNPQLPIYVGKAIPAGARKGGALADPLASKSLFSRLGEHAESIKAATNVELDDFVCRYLIIDEIWIPLGESLMIARFAPLWNSIVEGFGNHDPGSGRYQGQRPRWDVVHPGRAWALKCKDRSESAADILRDATTYLTNIVLTDLPPLTGAGPG